MNRLVASRSLFISLVAGVVWLLLWAWLTRAGGPVSTLYFPSPASVLQRLMRMWTRPYLGSTLMGHIVSSLSIVLTGWILAGIVGVPLGIAMAWWKRLRWIVFPVFQLVRPVPPLAWIPLTLVWMGIGSAARISVVFIAALVPWVMNSMQAVYSVDRLLIDAGKTLGANDRQILTRVVCRTALPTLVAGARIALGNAWTTLIAAELLAATAGLGYVALNASRMLDTDVLLLAMLTIGILGALLSIVMQLATRVLAPWSLRQARGE
jgi:ABC-type nitrate/sulfonate/bicarbonate transport system permease component